MSAEEEGGVGDEEAEKAYLQFYINVPVGPPLSQVLRDPEKRRKLGEFRRDSTPVASQWGAQRVSNVP